MAQSPNAMQEPSMDELLASIREIIEENTGPSPNRNANRQDTSSADAAFSAPNSAATIHSQSIHSTGGKTSAPAATPASTNAYPNPPHNAASRIEPLNKPNEHNLNAANPNTSVESPPVHDAMNALAARIGLRQNERPEPITSKASPQQDSHLTPPAPTAMILKKAPAERNLQAPSDSGVATQPRPNVQNAQNHGNMNTNSGNFNSASTSQGNAQNTGSRQVNIGGARPLNTNEHGIQNRNDTRPNAMLNQAAQHQPPVQPRPMEPAKARDGIPQRDMTIARENQGDGIMRQQPMSSAGTMPTQDGRHLPPKPRAGNAAARPNPPVNPAPSNSYRENPSDRRAHNEHWDENRGENRSANQVANEISAASPNVQTENGFEPRREAHVIQPLENEFVENNFPPKAIANPNAANVRGVSENRNNHEPLAPTPRPQATPQATPPADNNSDKNVPHPRSAPQKPHFLSQALRSAFLSIPAKDSAFQTASSLPQTPLRPQSVSARGIEQPTRVELKAAQMIEAEVKREMDNLDKAMEADFEKSAENLLRPYIAKWLDEHFSELFEKVLREEIKRVIQAQLR